MFATSFDVTTVKFSLEEVVVVFRLSRLVQGLSRVGLFYEAFCNVLGILGGACALFLEATLFAVSVLDINSPFCGSA